MAMFGSEKRKIEAILKLIEAGEDQEAYQLLKELLVSNPENISAWELLLKVSGNEKEQRFARYKLDQLQKSAPPKSPKKPKKAPKKEAAVAPAPVEDSARGEIRQAMKLLREGKRRKARRIVNGVLKKKPAFAPALYASGLLAETRKEHMSVLKQLAVVSERDPDATPYYQKLAARKFREKRRDKTPLWLLFGGFALLVLLVGINFLLPLFTEPDPDPISEVANEELTCEELIANALQVSDDGCSGIGSNQVCYGNYQLVSEYTGTSGDFNLVGDILGIEYLQKLKASPLDVAEQLWGVAVFKLAANMPGTVPGQNVTFLAFGNTEIDNDSGDMTAFYFSTGFGGLKCHDVDFDGLKIDMPDGAGIEFVANEVEIALQGDAIMVAQPGGEMDIIIVEGTAEVTADGVTRSLVPGTSVSIPISEGLAATGAPSEVTDVEGAQADLLCQLYGVNCPPGEVSVILVDPTITPEGTEVAAVSPTDTWAPTISLTPTITLTPTETPFGFVASDTPTPTITLTPTITPTFTITPTPTMSNTPQPGVPTTEVPTETPVTPTDTPVTPTDTPVTPTETPMTPTETPVTPTETPVTPTETPVTPAADSCDGITVNLTALVKFKVKNNSGSTIKLSSLTVQSWPGSNGNLKTVEFNSNKLDNLNLSAPASPSLGGGWNVNAGIQDLVLVFLNGKDSGEYRLILNFDNGCTIDQTYNK